MTSLSTTPFYLRAPVQKSFLFWLGVNDSVFADKSPAKHSAETCSLQVTLRSFCSELISHAGGDINNERAGGGRVANTSLEMNGMEKRKEKVFVLRKSAT